MLWKILIRYKWWKTWWKNSENYIVDPTNNRGLSSAFVKDTFAASLASWNNNSSSTIFGTEVTGVVDGIDTVSTDGKNEVMFRSIDESVGHHPDNTCTDKTMYVFASIDETQKRSLNAGDIAGINDLYWISLNF